MDTSILFKIDKRTKERAAKMAKKHGSTLSAFLRSATRAYADGDIEVGIEFSEETKRGIERGLRDLRAGKVTPAEEVFEELGF